jgi:hypothetical protein
MTTVVLSIGKKGGVEKVSGSPKQHCKNHQFNWIKVTEEDFYNLLSTGSLGRSLISIFLFGWWCQCTGLCSKNLDDNRKYIHSPWQIAVK